MKPIILGGVTLTLLSAAAAAAPATFPFLPLGGSSIAEMGVVLGVSAAVATVIDLFGSGRG